MFNNEHQSAALSVENVEIKCYTCVGIGLSADIIIDLANLYFFVLIYSFIIYCAVFLCVPLHTKAYKHFCSYEYCKPLGLKYFSIVERSVSLISLLFVTSCMIATWYF